MDQHLDELVYVVQKLREAEARLAQAISGDGLVAKLLAQDGVGLITAATMRAEIGRFDRFRSGKQLSRRFAPRRSARKVPRPASPAVANRWMRWLYQQMSAYG